jgi:tetratricopeptide (TPR) repeat protein
MLSMVGQEFAKHTKRALIQLAGTVAVAAALALSIQSPVHAQERVRPEIGKPLQAAQDLVKANRFKEALAKVREVDAIGGKSAYETYLVERMRGSAAAGAGDSQTAMRAFEAALGSGKAQGQDQLRMIEAIATSAYNARDFAAAKKWGTRYFEAGGSSGQMRTLMTQSAFQSGDYATVARESLAEITADEKAGRTPSEEKLQLLANSYLRQKNTTGYVSAIEKLLNYYPKKSLWADVISRLQSKPGFSDRFSLDVYRLKLATGNLTATNDYMEMAQLALQSGFAVEGKKVIEEGFKAGALGAGAEAERHKRLRDLADKKVSESQKMMSDGVEEKEANAASDGNALVKLGYTMATSGQSAKGIGMIEAGIKKGGLKRPEDAKLYLGIAQIQAGQKSKAIPTLRSIKGTDGVADLASLWALFAQKSA